MASIFGVEVVLTPFYVLGFLIAFFFLLNDFYKWLKYRTRGDFEFPLLGSIFFTIMFFADDLFLSILVSLMVVMIISTYEIRESPVWSKLMITFTFSYGYLLFFYVLSIIAPLFIEGQEQDAIDVLSQGIFGFGLSTTIWVLLIVSFIFFGRKFIMVSRFLSPNYIYLFIYALTYLVFLQLEDYLQLPDGFWQMRYFILFMANVLLYLVSAPLLKRLFGVKPVEDERILGIVDEIKTKMNVKVRSVGQVKAPILNAFAYGPFFDQRIAFVADDLANFTDDEIKGITAHELAHLKYKHTLMLLALGLFEMFIKFAINLPASSYDYLFADEVILPFVDYYIINMLIFAVLLTFVRFLEAQADEYSKKKGYGKELSKALFKLESFYQGIAGDIGLDVQLLTGRQRSETEKLRFSGISGRELYRKLVNPGRSSLAMNIIVSHPSTAFRIAKLVNTDKLHKVSKRRLATFQILLLLPYFRGKNLTFLRKLREQFSEALTEYYLEEFGSIENFLEASYGLEVAKQLEGREVICLPGNIPGGIWKGKVLEARAGKYITVPVVLDIDTGKQTLEISYSDYLVTPFEIGESYLIKNGTATLNDFIAGGNKLKRVIYDQNGKKIKKKNIGIPVRDLPVEGTSIFLHEKGDYKTARVREVSYSNYKTDSITVEKFAGEDAEVETISFKKLIISRAPFFIMFNRKKLNIQKKIFEMLMKEGSSVVLYEIEDLDIGIPGRVTAITPVNESKNSEDLSKNELIENDFEIHFTSGQEKKKYLASKVDALLIKSPYTLFYKKQEVSLGSRLSIYAENRGKTLKYV